MWGGGSGSGSETSDRQAEGGIQATQRTVVIGSCVFGSQCVQCTVGQHRRQCSAAARQCSARHSRGLRRAQRTAHCAKRGETAVRIAADDRTGDGHALRQHHTTHRTWYSAQRAAEEGAERTKAMVKVSSRRSGRSHRSGRGGGEEQSDGQVSGQFHRHARDMQFGSVQFVTLPVSYHTQSIEFAFAHQTHTHTHTQTQPHDSDRHHTVRVGTGCAVPPCGTAGDAVECQAFAYVWIEAFGCGGGRWDGTMAVAVAAMEWGV